MSTPTITGSIPAAPKQPIHTQRTFWSALVAGLSFVVLGINQFEPQLLPFVHDPRWKGVLTIIGGVAVALAPIFSRSGAVDDAAANSAAQITAATGKLP